MHIKPNRDLAVELAAAIEQIEDNVDRFNTGRDSAWQGVSVQLRKLFVDGLVSRAIRRPTFHPLIRIPDRAPPEPGLIPIVVAGPLFPRTNRLGFVVASLPVDPQAEPISVDLWLKERLIREHTIHALIKEPANQEAAHTDAERRALMLTMTDHVRRLTREEIASRAFDGGVKDRELYKIANVAIGEYAARRIRDLTVSDAAG